MYFVSYEAAGSEVKLAVFPHADFHLDNVLM
jgi:hypothetical protein